MNTDPMTGEALIASPCIGVCTVDRARSLCIGCLRTLREIGAWRTMTLDEKRVTIAACAERAKTLPRLGKDWRPLDESGKAPGETPVKTPETKLP